MRIFTILPAFTLSLVLAAGCTPPEVNPTPPAGESDVLTDAVELTHGFHRAGEAYFSPDMKWIIFQASQKPDEDYQMYVAQVRWEQGATPTIAGLNTPIRITPVPSWNSCGNFSPDGESLIFASTALKPQVREERGGYQRNSNSYRWEMPSGAEIFRADGWKGAVSAIQPGGSVDLARYPLTNNDVHDAECGYSPDGKWIVFAEMSEPPKPAAAAGVPAEMIKPATAPATTGPAAGRGGALQSAGMDLYVMTADGKKKRRLTTTPGYDGGPFFSPDGKRLVYRSDRKGNELLQVFVSDVVFDAAGDIVGLANERQLTNDANVNWGPYWHPDGHHLVWATTKHGHANFEIYLMRDDGSHKTRVTFWNGFDGLPVFSPDGKWMMWTSKRGPEKTSQIWVARFRMPEGS